MGQQVCATFRVEQLLGIESIDNFGIFGVRRAVFNGLWKFLVHAG